MKRVDCQRCGTYLDFFGRCQNKTCPFSNCAQDDSGGWEGYPHDPGKYDHDDDGQPIVYAPVVEATLDVADAFSLRGLPNVRVIDVRDARDDVIVDSNEAPVQDDQLKTIVDVASPKTRKLTLTWKEDGRVVRTAADIEANREAAEDALDLAAADCGWNGRSRIGVLLDFIAGQGLSVEFEEYINNRADEECKECKD